MYLPRERKRVKIWNKAKPNGEFQNGDDDKRDLKAVLCLAALHLCASVIAHLFRRLPALATCGEPLGCGQPVGNLRAAILIFAIHIFNRKDDLDLNSSGQHNDWRAARDFGLCFLTGLYWTRWQLRWRNVASCSIGPYAPAMFPSTLFFFNLIFIHRLSWNKYWLGLVGGEMRKRSKRSFDQVFT